MSTEDYNSILKEMGEITQISGGFQKSLILQVAVKNNLFSYLSQTDGGDINNISNDFDWDKRSARIFLDSLAGIGFLKKENGKYLNNKISEKYLVEGKEYYMGDIIKHYHNLLQGSWSGLENTLKTGNPSVDRKVEKRSEEQLKNFILGMSNLAGILAKQIISMLDISKYRRMLDVGGGPGTYPITFCEHNPDMKAVVFDLPDVMPILEGQIKKYGLENRIISIPGNLKKDDFGKSYDLVLIANIIHMLSEEEIIGLFKKSYDALDDGGDIFIKDFVPDDERKGPEMPLIFAVNMLVGTEKGDSYTESQISSFLEDSGFKGIESYPLNINSKLIKASKRI